MTPAEIRAEAERRYLWDAEHVARVHIAADALAQAYPPFKSLTGEALMNARATASIALVVVDLDPATGNLRTTRTMTPAPDLSLRPTRQPVKRPGRKR